MLPGAAPTATTNSLSLLALLSVARGSPAGSRKSGQVLARRASDGPMGVGTDISGPRAGEVAGQQWLPRQSRFQHVCCKIVWEVHPIPWAGPGASDHRGGVRSLWPAAKQARSSLLPANACTHVAQASVVADGSDHR